MGLAVKRPCTFTLARPIADRAEGTLGLLRYPLGGDRPSQTAHLALSAARLHGAGLELKHNKAGVSVGGSARSGERAS